jgi:hypothetical protein
MIRENEMMDAIDYMTMPPSLCYPSWSMKWLAKVYEFAGTFGEQIGVCLGLAWVGD